MKILFILLVMYSANSIALETIDELGKEWQSTYNAGLNFIDNKALEDAEFSLLKSLEIANKIGVSAVMASSLSSLGRLYELKSDLLSAEKYYNDAAGITQRLRGTDHLEVALDLYNLCRVKTELKKYMESTKLLYYAMRVLQKNNKHYQPIGKEMMKLVLINAEGMGDYKQAKSLKEKMNKIQWEEKIQSPIY